MTHDEAIDFGRFIAVMALDQKDLHGSVQDTIDSYRENVRDTLNEHRASEHEPDAFAAFDAYIASKRKQA